MQDRLWIGAAAAMLLAIVSGILEHRRQRRRNLDRVGLVPWPLVQFLALTAATICAALALGLI